MLKNLTNAVKASIQRTVNETVDNIVRTPENIVNNITDKFEMQEYVYGVVSKMEHGQDLWNWSRGYWLQHDTGGRVEPVVDRKAYMKKGKSFKKGKVYKMGPMFQGEISIGASVGDLGTVYNLDDLKTPAQYAVAKDKDTVMLFNWIAK